MGKMVSIGCLQCGKEFKKDNERNTVRYCSVVCRFLSKIKISPNGCWEWKAGKTKAGYGIFPIDGKLIYAHRFSYQHFIGPIKDKLLICHKCDNPGCVAPHHFFAGTQADNHNDCTRKGRRPHGETHWITKKRRREQAHG